MFARGRLDQHALADVLVNAHRCGTDPHCLRRLESTEPTIVELREWSRLSEDLTRERVRLGNRMRDQLWRYYPQFLDAVDSDVAAPWALDRWRSLPTPRAGQRVRQLTLTRVLKQHRIPRIDAATLRELLRAPAFKLAPGAIEAATCACAAGRRTPRSGQPSARSCATRTRPTGAPACRGCSGRLPRTRPQRMTRTRRHSSPTQPFCYRCPGSARVCSPRCSPRPATRSSGATTTHFCICGVAPVTQRSGKSLLVTRRLAAPGRLRDAAYHWARVAAQHDAVSHDKYRTLRSRGHGHARALRSVADRLLNVACAMLRNGTCFDPRRVGISAT